MATSYITNAALAQQITDLLNKWQVRETQMQAWMGGTATGGPYANGTYPLTDVLQNTTYQPSPAALVSGVGVSVTSAAAYATAAAVSATAAASSATGAAASASTATTQATAAATSSTTASGFATAAANSKTFAQTYATNALASQVAAAASAASIVGSVSAAAASATAAASSASAAAGSATSAAASAVLAATFNPALYAALAGATFTGSLAGTSASFSTTLHADGAATFGSNVTLSAPSSGIALTASGVVGNFVASFLGSSSSGNSVGVLIQAGTSATDAALWVKNQAATKTFLLLNGDDSGSLAGLSWSAGGNVSIAAPSSGTALTVGTGTSGIQNAQIGLTVFGVGVTFLANQAEMFTTSTTSLNIGTVGGAALNFYTSATPRFSISSAGAASFSGTVAASNLSGTNTGDQNLAPYALLAGATFSGAVSASNLSGTNTGDQPAVVCVKFQSASAPAIGASRNAGSPTISRIAAGEYTITWAPGFTPTFAVCSQGAGATTTVGLATITVMTSTSVQVVTTSISGGTADLNAPFTLWAQ